MFRDGGIELNDVGDWQVRDEKPARTKNACHSTAPSFDAAEGEYGNQQ